MNATHCSRQMDRRTHNKYIINLLSGLLDIPSPSTSRLVSLTACPTDDMDWLACET